MLTCSMMIIGPAVAISLQLVSSGESSLGGMGEGVVWYT